jgi:hypothetical protein
MREDYFERNMDARKNIYFGRYFLGWDVNLALFCNLNFTKVYINLKKYVIHSLNFVRSVYLNLFRWRGA